MYFSWIVVSSLDLSISQSLSQLNEFTRAVFNVRILIFASSQMKITMKMKKKACSFTHIITFPFMIYDLFVLQNVNTDTDFKIAGFSFAKTVLQPKSLLTRVGTPT